MKTTTQSKTIEIGTRVSLQPAARATAIGATTGTIIGHATTASGWQEGGQVRVRWSDGETTWEPLDGLRTMSGGPLA